MIIRSVDVNYPAVIIVDVSVIRYLKSVSYFSFSGVCIIEWAPVEFMQRYLLFKLYYNKPNRGRHGAHLTRSERCTSLRLMSKRRGIFHPSQH